MRPSDAVSRNGKSSTETRRQMEIKRPPYQYTALSVFRSLFGLSHRVAALGLGTRGRPARKAKSRTGRLPGSLLAEQTALELQLPTDPRTAERIPFILSSAYSSTAYPFDPPCVRGLAKAE